MEEKLDKLISLMESQNKAWQKSLQLLDGIHMVLVEKYRAADLLLEEHPPMGAPQPESQRVRSAPPTLNTFGDQKPYGYELEEERKAPAQSFPATAQVNEEPEQQQPAFRDPPPTVPVTSKAEMMEQAERVERIDDRGPESEL